MPHHRSAPPPTGQDPVAETRSRLPIDPIDRIGPDDEERLDRRDRLHPEDAPHRFATRAEVRAFIAELDAKYFPSVEPEDPRPSWPRDRLRGAQGD